MRKENRKGLIVEFAFAAVLRLSALRADAIISTRRARLRALRSSPSRQARRSARARV